MNDKPKFSARQVVNKSMILWGISDDIKKQLRIYSRKNLETRTKPVLSPCIVVDYNKDKREWYIFLYSEEQILSCTVDDINGNGSIQPIK